MSHRVEIVTKERIQCTDHVKLYSFIVEPSFPDSQQEWGAFMRSQKCLTTNLGNYTHVSGDIFRRSILLVKGTPPRGVGGCLPDPAEISTFYRFFCGNKLSTHFTPYLHSIFNYVCKAV